MKILSKTEVRYIVAGGVESSVLSKNAYVPREIEVGNKKYGFFVNEEEDYIHVLTIVGSTDEEFLNDGWKIKIE